MDHRVDIEMTAHAIKQLDLKKPGLSDEERAIIRKQPKSTYKTITEPWSPLTMLYFTTPKPVRGAVTEGMTRHSSEHVKADNEAEENLTKDTPAEEETDDDDDDDEDILGLNYGIFWLAAVTVFIAILSDALAATIEDAASEVGVSSIFLAAIVLPIVGNAAEHAGAVMFAMKGKLDLTLGVAIGSSTQIALFVLPLLVLLGWIADLDMSLNFGLYESCTLLLTVLLVTFAIKDGSSNYLMGVTLLFAYFIIAIGFCVHIDDSL